MKIRGLLTVVAMLSVLLFGIGTAYAIYGVADDVPGQDLAWPVICAKTPTGSNSLNTNWAIADVIGGRPASDGNITHTSCQIKDSHSRKGPDFDYWWTPLQVVVDTCQNGLDGLLDRHPAAKVTVAGAYEPIVNVGGTDYYVLYVTCSQDDPLGIGYTIWNRFMNNVYLLDPPMGFAAAINGPSLEDGSDALIGEAGGSWHMTASNIYARYYINNDTATFPNTWDWLITFLGRNQYGTAACFTSRTLTGTICDENEHCTSANIPIPWELNIFNVGPTLPGSPFFTPLGNHNASVAQTFPKAGFYALGITESGAVTGVGPLTISGTTNSVNALCQSSPSTYYSLFGWSYERAQAASVIGDFDVIHPYFRRYCSGGVDGTGASQNLGTCACSGDGCAD